jgi:hypothetical protein
MKGGDSFSRMGEGQGEGDEESRLLIWHFQKGSNECLQE